MRLCSTCLTWSSRTANPWFSPTMLLDARRHQCTHPLAVCSNFAKLNCTSSKSFATGPVHSQLLEAPVKCSFLHLLICLNSVGSHRLTACNHRHSTPNNTLGVWDFKAKCALDWSIHLQSNEIPHCVNCALHMCSDNAADLPTGIPRDTWYLADNRTHPCTPKNRERGIYLSTG